MQACLPGQRRNRALVEFAVHLIKRGNHLRTKAIAGQLLRQTLQVIAHGRAVARRLQFVKAVSFVLAGEHDLLLFGFGELLGAAVDFSLCRGDAGGLFLLLLFGFGELLCAALIFGLWLGDALGGLFRAFVLRFGVRLAFCAAVNFGLRRGDASGLFLLLLFGFRSRFSATLVFGP